MIDLLKNTLLTAFFLIISASLLLVGCGAPRQMASPKAGQEEVALISAEIKNPITYHDGYWVADLPVENMPVSIQLINDMHIDPTTNAVTVYAQTKLRDNIIVPAQVGPGEFGTLPNGDPIGFHPNAVYLNGSGQELSEADGTGEWWVKHAWILNGEGFENCEPVPQKVYDDCFWVEGYIQDDGLTIKAGQQALQANGFYNLRTPLLAENPISYQITRFEPANSDPAAGAIDLTPTEQSVLTFQCEERPSALDNQPRSCPELSN